ECGVDVEAQHHEVATGGQCEIDMKYAPLLKTADNLLRYKYIVKNVAVRHGKTATFMPKPLWNDNGSGLHLHMSLWKEG
ncbi:MAG TPA: glutamine synthetase, partial [Planctomycetaceae bacterium]|nr:glutamine synthetase [Planctomycetaceae bacterium]